MNKFYQMLSIARKANKVVFGYDTTVGLIKNGSKDILVIIAEDASEKTKKNVIFECNRYECKYLEYGEKVVYGRVLNKKEVSVVAVTDSNIISYLKNNT